MRLRLPHLTFLTRFGIATFALAVVAAVVLATAVESLHRGALERDEIASAAGLVDAELGRALRAPDRRAALAQVEANAQLFPYVTGMRVFDPAGHPMWPPGTRAVSPALVARVAAGDGLVTIDEGRTRAAYSPLVIGGVTKPLLVAVDFSPENLAAQFRGEHAAIVGVTIAVIAIIFGSLAALAAGASRELERRRRDAEQTLVGTLSVMADTIDYRDPYTAGHSKRVAAYAKRLATEMRLSPEEIATVEHSALLHDLGKIGIPDAVLFKPAALDPRERKIIGRHPVIGASILSGIPGMTQITPCVLHHHERWDGKGYPEKLAGEAIPLGARIIAVADAFDAMTTDRPYRRALRVDEAADELLDKASVQFDARCVEVFAKLLRGGEIAAPAPRPAAELVFGVRAELEVS